MISTTLQKKISKYTQEALIRKNITITAREKNYITVNDKVCINFSSNDYLGLSTSEKLLTAFANAAKTYGFGGGSSVAVCGFFKDQYQLEQEFAQFLQRDRAIFFNSGYLANIGVITALAAKDQIVIADKYCHASIIDGIQITKAKYFRYHHNDISQLQNLVMTNKNSFVITEGVFSMMGGITPISTIATITKSQQSMLIVDDAHGIGVLGNNGGGSCEHFQLSQNEVHCLIAPLGKAFGSYGAIVAGNHQLMDAITQFARSYRYTTALPPAVCAANLQALAIIKSESWRREKLSELIEFFIEQAKIRNLSLVSEDKTPIKCILVADSVLLLKIQQQMLECGFFIAGIRPPTVPKNMARIRISLNCYHEKSQIIKLLDNLAIFINDFDNNDDI